MNPTKTYYESLAKTVIANLEKRQIEGYYCPTAKEGLNKALSFINKSDVISFGGSVTLAETGLLDALRADDSLQLLDRDTANTVEERNEIFHKALLSDTYFMSTNAITTDGELINIDGNGNRVAALIYGPKQVIILAGMNKIATTTNEGLSRVRNTATPLNCIRLNKQTACATTGVCHDCLSPDCICNQIVVTRRSGQKGRIKVILIGENLGY